MCKSLLWNSCTLPLQHLCKTLSTALCLSRCACTNSSPKIETFYLADRTRPPLEHATASFYILKIRKSRSGVQPAAGRKDQCCAASPLFTSRRIILISQKMKCTSKIAGGGEEISEYPEAAWAASLFSERANLWVKRLIFWILEGCSRCAAPWLQIFY